MNHDVYDLLEFPFLINGRNRIIIAFVSVPMHACMRVCMHVCACMHACMCVSTDLRIGSVGDGVQSALGVLQV